MYDFIIVGGGILAMSTAMQLIKANPNQKILVVEKEDSPAQHQTGRNSGVIHAGVYYTPGSLKARFCLEGNLATKAFCEEHQIPYEQCGKLLIATNELEMQRMQALWQRTEANGLDRQWLNTAELREAEPNIIGLGGILVPSSGIVDYRKIAEVMAKEFIKKGGEIHYSCPVIGLDERANEVVVKTNRGDLTTKFMISCAGLMADRIVKMLGKTPNFAICPFRGEYFQLPQQHNSIVNHLIYPIPDPSMPFLGVHLTRMIDGSVTVGPNAVLAWKREGYNKGDFSFSDTISMLSNSGIRKALLGNIRSGLVEMKNSLHKQGYLNEVRKYCPSLNLDDLLPHPAGVRAQAIAKDGSLIDDFLFFNTKRTFNVCNAPSPAATSAIPIGKHIVKEVLARTLS
ncbi:MAG: L-2-hydroxyglutarate oxidase [Paraglaciecola polaris]|uniref:L-2-hydroxyglutarate oxidase n=1 Tax=Paraglaciecola polaris TaxID=222814 RepID=UPI0030014D53